MKQQKWNKEQLQTARTLAETMLAEAQTGLTVEQNMKNALASRLEGVDAGLIVDDLCDGIDLFHDGMQKAEEKGTTALVQDVLDQLLQDKTPDEQATQLSKVLTACAQAAGQQPPQTGDASQIPAMRDAICEYFSEYALLHIDCAASAQLMQDLGDSQQAMWQAEEKRLDERYMALALYIQKATGNLDGVPDELDAKQIGVSAAAALCEQRTILAGILGRVDWDTVRARLKLIAGVAAAALLIVVAAKLALVLGGLTFLFVQAIVGMGIIGTIAAVFLGLVTVKQIVTAGADLVQKVAEVTGLDQLVHKGLEKLGNWYQNTLRPAMQAFWERVRQMLNRPADKAETQDTAQDQTETTARQTSPAEQTAHA